MQTVTYDTLLRDIVALNGQEYGYLTTEEATMFRTSVNRALREIWISYPWPETLVFASHTAGGSGRVYGLQQFGENEVNAEYIWGVWDKDPRTNLDACYIENFYMDGSIHIQEGAARDSLSIAYVRRPSQVPSSTPIDTTSFLFMDVGTYGLTTDGEYFEARANFPGGLETGGVTYDAAKVKDGPATITSGNGENWLWHYIPKRLQTAITWAALADYYSSTPEEGKTPERAIMMRDRAVDEAIDRVERLEGSWYKFVTRYG